MTRKEILRRLPLLQSETVGLSIDSDFPYERFKVMPCFTGRYFTDGFLAVLRSSPGVERIVKIIGNVPTNNPAPKEFAQLGKGKYLSITAIRKAPEPTWKQIRLVCEYGEAAVDPARLRMLIQLTECDEIGAPVARGRVSVDRPVLAIKDGKPVGFLAQMTR